VERSPILLYYKKEKTRDSGEKIAIQNHLTEDQGAAWDLTGWARETEEDV